MQKALLLKCFLSVPVISVMVISVIFVRGMLFLMPINNIFIEFLGEVCSPILTVVTVTVVTDLRLGVDGGVRVDKLHERADRGLRESGQMLLVSEK